MLNNGKNDKNVKQGQKVLNNVRSKNGWIVT